MTKRGRKTRFIKSLYPVFCTKQHRLNLLDGYLIFLRFDADMKPFQVGEIKWIAAK